MFLDRGHHITLLRSWEPFWSLLSINISSLTGLKMQLTVRRSCK